MKANILLVSLLLFIFSFTSPQSEQLTEQQKNQIKNEVTLAFDSIMARLERMDVEGALQYYSPNFVAFGSDGNKVGLQELRKEYVNLYSSSSSYKWTSYNFNFISVNKETAVITTDGRNECIFKSGGKLIFDPSHYTFAFEKIEGKWKLFYHHFSGTLLKEKIDEK